MKSITVAELRQNPAGPVVHEDRLEDAVAAGHAEIIGAQHGVGDLAPGDHGVGVVTTAGPDRSSTYRVSGCIRVISPGCQAAVSSPLS